MNKIFVAWASAVLFFSSSLTFAAGEIAPCPELKVGTTYKYLKKSYGVESTEILKIIKVEGDVVEAEINGKVLPFDRILNPTKEWEGRSEFKAPFYLLPNCPFSSGVKKYPKTDLVGSSGTTLKGFFTVDVNPGSSEISVPAGKFQVFQVSSQFSYAWEKTTTMGSGLSNVTSYYSPQLGVIVKLEFNDKYGDKFTKELVEVSLAK